MIDASFFLGKMGRCVSNLPSGALRFFAQDMPWDANKPKPVPIPPSATWINSYLELIFAGIGVLCALIMLGYYCYGFYLQRVAEKNQRIKRRYWTVDKINACLIPLGIAAGFVAHYLMTR